MITANESILIVEDNPTERELLTEALRTYELSDNLVTVDGAKPALDYIYRRGRFEARRSEPCMAILDLDLPDMHGFEVLKAIREHPEHSDLPVLVLTGSDSALDAAVARELGASSFVVKPSDWSGLQNIARSSAIFLAGKKKRQTV